MGCIESTPVYPRTTVVYTTYPVTNQNVNSQNLLQKQIQVNHHEKPPLYNPNLNNQQYYYPPTHQQQLYNPYNQNPQHYNNQQPSTLGTFGAVVGGVLVGEVLSDILFD